MKKFLLYLFYPFSALYGCATAVRNFFYNAGLCKSKHHSVLIISVGNLNFGGSGKTPHVIYLADMLHTMFKVAILSRGYGRNTKGFREVKRDDSAVMVGDEPLMYACRYNDVPVAVDENRNHGIGMLQRQYPDLDVIILDDAFQHRSVYADLSVLLSDYSKPFYKDKVFPFGTLREYKRGYKRADIMIFSKVPENISALEKRAVLDSVKETVYQDIFFSSIQYGELQALNPGTQTPRLEQLKEVVVVTGIANPEPLWKHLETYNMVCHKMNFGDHHYFKTQEIENMINLYQHIECLEKAVLTTEKDAMRLKGNENLSSVPVFYIPINVVIHLENQKRGINLNEKIIKYVRENKTNSKFNTSYRIL